MADVVNDEDKKFPNATEGVAGLLNITPHGNTGPRTEAPELESDSDAYTMFADKSVPAPSNLPIGDFPEEEAAASDAVQTSVGQDIAAAPLSTASVSDVPSIETPQDLSSVIKTSLPLEEPRIKLRGWNLVKKVLPYFAIFILAIGLYFFYFNDFSFTNLFNSQSLKLESVTNSNTNKDYDQLKKDATADYNVWFAQFFSDVNDDSISSMDADVSGNGLTNFEKYLLNLNPKVYSTQGNGTGDGQAVLDGVNPWTGKTFTDSQKALVDKYLNPELISNRITAAAITRGVTKYAQYVNPDSPYYIDPATLQKVGSNGQVIVSPTQISTTTPANVPTNNNANNSVAAPPQLRPDEAIDQSKTALLEIPANNISTPLTWTQDVKDFENDLKKGVVHYPGTAMLGDPGTAYISGHSSGYLWDKSAYKQIFSKLGDVKDGTSFSITATQLNGKTVKYDYVVDHRGEFAANDQSQFLSTADSIVALSTCWPVNTTARRLVLFAKLTQTERS